jgi:Flp pilus assembly protein TadB
MENGYDKVAGYVMAGVVIIIALIAFAYALPWLILIAAIVGGIWLYFWQRSTRRESHPWD